MNISHVQFSPGGRERVKKNGIDEIQALERMNFLRKASDRGGEHK